MKVKVPVNHTKFLQCEPYSVIHTKFVLCIPQPIHQERQRAARNTQLMLPENKRNVTEARKNSKLVEETSGVTKTSIPKN